MVIYLGADHNGVALQDRIRSFLKEQGYEVVDTNPAIADPQDDYPDSAAAVAGKISQDPGGSRGIVICGSGAGVTVVANKFRGALATLGFSADQVYSARHDDNVNILAVAAKFTREDDVMKMVRTFLDTSFDTTQERYRRRLDKIAAIEDRNFR